MLEHGGGHFYLIFDASQANAEAVADWKRKATLSALTAWKRWQQNTFMDKDTFLKTVDRYNELKGQEDADFGKAAALMTGLGEGPYHASAFPTAVWGCAAKRAASMIFWASCLRWFIRIPPVFSCPLGLGQHFSKSAPFTLAFPAVIGYNALCALM